MAVTFTTGDIALKQFVFDIVRQNEISRLSPYTIVFADPGIRSDSAWSFGWTQLDVKASTLAKDVLMDILIKAQDTDPDGITKFIVDDGDPTTDREGDTKIADLLAKAGQRNPSALTAAERFLIDWALASPQGQRAVDAAVEPEIDRLLQISDRIVNLAPASDKAFWSDRFGRAFVVDYGNQYGITPGFLFETFVKTGRIALSMGSYTKQGPMRADDVLNYYLRNLYPWKNPADPLRRFSTIVAKVGYTPNNADEALGLFRAATYFVARNRGKLEGSRSSALILSNFVSTVLDPARSLVNQELRARYPSLQNVSLEAIPSLGILVDPVYPSVQPDHAAYLYARRFDANRIELLDRNILVGEGGGDVLIGGKGDDILIGGRGDDIYFWEAGDGNDRIVEERDGDGLIHGRLVITDTSGTRTQSLTAGGVFVQVAGQANTWLNPATGLTLTHSSPWQIVMHDGASIELGGDLRDGDYGIHLVEDRSAPALPITTREINGDRGIFEGRDTVPDQNPAGGGGPLIADASWVNVRVLQSFLNADGVAVAYEVAYNVKDDLDNLVRTSTPRPDMADTLFDSAGDDLISAGSGNDTILASRGGADLIFTEASNDRIQAGAGNDWVLAGADVDTLFGEAGEDMLDGGAGRDAISGGEGKDLILGGEGGDIAGGDAGADWVYGGAFALDTAQLILAGETDAVDAGPGDLLTGGEGDDIVAGAAAADLLFGARFRPRRTDLADILRSAGGPGEAPAGAAAQPQPGSGVRESCARRFRRLAPVRRQAAGAHRKEDPMGVRT